MEQVPEIQKALFEQIRECLPAQISFVHEIAELPGISYYSACRRIEALTISHNNNLKAEMKIN